jgi:hypothetical protein
MRLNLPKQITPRLNKMSLDEKLEFKGSLCDLFKSATSEISKLYQVIKLSLLIAITFRKIPKELFGE